MTVPSGWTLAMLEFDELHATLGSAAFTGVTTTLNRRFPLRATIAVEGDVSILVADAWTITVDPAAKPPSIDLAVMVVEPASKATTFPLLSTDATEGFEDRHSTVLFVAEAGATVAVSRCDWCARRESVGGLTTTPVAATEITVTEALAVNPPSQVRAVTVAVPVARP